MQEDINFDSYLPPMPQPVGSQSDLVQGEMMQSSRMSSILSQLDPEVNLADVEHRIRRMRKDHFTGTWIQINKNQKPVSEELVANMISYLSPLLTLNVTFSNYTEDEINRIMALIISDAIQDLSANAKLYGIEGDYSEMDRITQIMCTTAFSTLKRSLKGSESSRFWKAVTIRGDIMQPEEQKQKKGVLDYLKFW